MVLRIYLWWLNLIVNSARFRIIWDIWWGARMTREPRAYAFLWAFFDEGLTEGKIGSECDWPHAMGWQPGWNKKRKRKETAEYEYCPSSASWSATKREHPPWHGPAPSPWSSATWIEHLKRATQNFLSLICFSHGLSHNDVISNKYTNIFELIKYQFVHFGSYLRNLNLRYYLNLLIH